jgi:hypothetical protein
MYPEIAVMFTSLKTMKDIAFAVMGAEKKYDEAEMKLKFAAVVGQSVQFESELRELERKLNARDSVEYDDADGVCWKIGKERKGDPYCPRCHEKDGIPIHMQSSFEDGGLYWICIQCRKTIRKDRRQRPPTPNYRVL